MRRFFREGVALSGLLLFAINGSAQAQRNYQYRESAAGPIDRLRRDLDRAESAYRVSGGDHRRFDHARGSIADFDRKMSMGRFDRRELDRAIGDTQHVVDSNALSYRDRAALIDDLRRMRQFRACSSGSYRPNDYDLH